MRVTRLDGAEGPLAARRRVSRERPDAVVAPLAGGAAGLLGRSAPLISLLAAPPAGGGGSRLRRWLERRQARGSVLLVAPERPVAVACAQRWGLDLARIRLVAGSEGGLADDQVADLLRRRPGGRAWHLA